MNQDLAINTFSELDHNIAIPLGFKIELTDNFLISASDFENIDDGIEILLGEKIYHENFDNLLTKKLVLNKVPGYYFVKLTTDKQVYSQKVYINK